MQKYIPEVEAGDKRVILVNGEPIGAINRVPSEVKLVKYAVGGVVELKNIYQKEICKFVKVGALMKKGQILVGLDIIGGFLTEINLSCRLVYKN